MQGLGGGVKVLSQGVAGDTFMFISGGYEKVPRARYRIWSQWVPGVTLPGVLQEEISINSNVRGEIP